MKHKDQLSSNDGDGNGELSISGVSKFSFFAILAIRLI